MDKRDARRDRSATERGVATESRVAEDTDAKLKNILKKADEIAASRTMLDLDAFEPPESSKSPAAPADIQDIDEAHDDFYKAYHNVVMKYVEYGELRHLILKMGKLYLKEGKTTGRDCRQARPSQREPVREIVIDWVMEHNGQNPSELFFQLRQLNKNAGYL